MGKSSPATALKLNPLPGQSKDEVVIVEGNEIPSHNTNSVSPSAETPPDRSEVPHAERSSDLPPTVALTTPRTPEPVAELTGTKEVSSSLVRPEPGSFYPRAPKTSPQNSSSIITGLMAKMLANRSNPTEAVTEVKQAKGGEKRQG